MTVTDGRNGNGRNGRNGNGRNGRNRGPTVAAVYGGGGVFGIGYTLGIAEAFVDAGVPLGRYPALGTSAGAWAAAGLALKVRFLDAVDQIGSRAPRFPDPRAGRLRAAAAEIYGPETKVESMRVVVCPLPRLSRVVLSGADHPVADLVAASSAVPGLVPPHSVAGTRYLDGGVRSLVSVDLADPADLLLVVAPLAGAMFGPAGRFVDRRVSGELARWRKENPGSRVMVIRPSSEVAALARRPDHLFDVARARAGYEVAYEQGKSLVDDWEELHRHAAQDRIQRETGAA